MMKLGKVRESCNYGEYPHRAPRCILPQTRDIINYTLSLTTSAAISAAISVATSHILNSGLYLPLAIFMWAIAASDYIYNYRLQYIYKYRL